MMKVNWFVWWWLCMRVWVIIVYAQCRRVNIYQCFIFFFSKIIVFIFVICPSLFMSEMKFFASKSIKHIIICFYNFWGANICREHEFNNNNEWKCYFFPFKWHMLNCIVANAIVNRVLMFSNISIDSNELFYLSKKLNSNLDS